MKEPKDVRFSCPQCGRKMVALDFVAAKGIHCPDCGTEFVPDKFEELEQVQTPAPAFQRQLGENEDVELKSRRKKIHGRAFFFECAAVLFLIVALFLFFVTVRGSVDATFAIAAPGCIGAALWFYLVAQIIHIRANTEK